MATVFALPARIVAQVHTVLGASAFASALLIAWVSGLWIPLCDNAVSKWPVEWFPSVSATIGDHAPPRAPFHILIALCATPRFILLLAQWLAHRYLPSSSHHKKVDGEASAIASANATIRTRARATSSEVADKVSDPLEQAIHAEEVRAGGSSADLELLVGLARTFCCGGWVYITSRDQHDIHDLFMIIYLILTLPWMFLSTQNSLSDVVRRRRQMAFGGFLLSIPPLIWLYYRHSVLRIPGAYTHYAFLEWSLVFWDVAFDSVAMSELKHLRIAVIDTSTILHGHPRMNGLTDGIFIQPSQAARTIEQVDWTAHIKDEITSSHGRAVLAWLSDVYLAVCFWTVFTSLAFQLFYWSVWKLALAGSELALLANLSGYTLASKRARQYVTSKDGLLTHRVIMVIAGMGCHLIPSPAARLLSIAVGTWTGWLALFGNWMRLQGSPEMYAEGEILGLGLIITILLKYVNASTNPFWATTDSSSGGWNITGLVLAGLALYEYSSRPLELHPAPPIMEVKDKPVASMSSTRWQRLAITAGLGSLIHMIQTFAMDAGTIIAWTWTGYPIKGPTLHPFAALVLTAVILGLLINRHSPQEAVAFSACVGAFILYRFPDWTGMAGGVVLVTSLTALVPPFLRAASVLPPASTFGNAMALLCLLDVLSVVTTAYAFVPLGWLVRERTDLILAICMTSICAGVNAMGQLRLPTVERLYKRSVKRIENTRRWTQFTLILVCALAWAAGLSHMPKHAPVPYFPEHRLFTGGIWAVHFGVDEPGRDSQRRMMELLRDMQVDVVGLLETDLHRFVYGNRDLTRVISEELGYYVDLGPGPNKHTWGAALLSKFPILNSTHHLLPSPHGELAPAIHATLDIHGEKVNVWVSHNGQEEDPLDRELQTIEIARNLRETADVPTVFLGYLVTHPGDLRPWPYQILMEDGMMYDIEVDDEWRWCEYVAFRGLWRVAYARVHESDISDTELQVGKFLLPLPGQKVDYQSNEEMYWHIGESDIPEPWRMPRAFWDEGVRGHKYVVWQGPVYYFPPERSGLREYGWGWSTSLSEEKGAESHHTSIAL